MSLPQVAVASGGDLCNQVAALHWRRPTQCMSVDTVDKETSDPTLAIAQTSCVCSDLQQTRSDR